MGMTQLFHAYNSTEKCFKQIDVCVQNMFALNTPNMIPFLKRWVDTDRNDWDSIQMFLTDSRSLLRDVKYIDNNDAKKLKLIERIMYVRAEIKENEDEVCDEESRLHECIDTIVQENKTQYPDVLHAWEKMNSTALRNNRSPHLSELHYIAIQKEGWVSMEKVREQIEAAMKEQQEFRDGINTGVGRAIKTDVHADKVRTDIIHIGFDTMTTISKLVPDSYTHYPEHYVNKVRTAMDTDAQIETAPAGAVGRRRRNGAKPVSAGARENITQSIHAALVKLAN
jgi:hypothetical protein